MITKTFTIDLELTDGDILDTGISLVSQDTQYIFSINLLNSNSTLDLSDVDHAKIYFRKPDKTYFNDDVVISDAVDGVVTYTFTSNDPISANGNICAEIKLFNADESSRLTTQSFEFNSQLAINN